MASSLFVCMCHSLRPWDSMNDVVQYEHNMVIQTKTRHQTPIVHATSLLHVDDLPRSHRRTRSRCLGSTSLHRVHRDDGSSSSDRLEMFSAHDLDFSGKVVPLSLTGSCSFYARQHICCSAYMLWQFRLSVCLSVCHTGGSVKNG